MSHVAVMLKQQNTYKVLKTYTSVGE